MTINHLSGRERTTKLVCAPSKAPYIGILPFEGKEHVVSGFSTRLGGVSSGIYESMNLASSRGDDPENVRRNFELIGRSLSVSPEQMVYAHQTHTANVMRVTREYCGMGIIRERSFSDVDALVTDEPGVCLVTGHADCIPLFFIDEKRRAIGLAHAGWRGTVNDIAGNLIRMMEAEFGTDPKDIEAFIGPGICRDHYEVGEDVAGEFLNRYEGPARDQVLSEKQPGTGERKYLLDLHMANFHNMNAAGMSAENIYLTDLCTFCNPELFFSHRYTKGQRGGMCAFLMLR